MTFDEEISREIYGNVIDYCNANGLTLEGFLVRALEALEEAKGTQSPENGIADKRFRGTDSGL